MNEITVTPSDTIAFRAVAFAFACLVGGLAAWELSADLLRPITVEFPTDRRSAISAYPQHDAAVAAAEIGVIRGDLWADAAFANGNLLWTDDEHLSDADTVSIERTRALTEHAIRWAPHNARLWLLLATTYFRTDSLDQRPTGVLNNEKLQAALRLCYYTGSNTVDLIQSRLFFVLQSRLLEDDEFQEFVRHDFEIAVMRKAEFAPIIAATYKNAPPPAKQFIEKTLGELDPGLLTSIRTKE